MSIARLPFSGLLHDVSEAKTTEEILKIAGMDWEMAKAPVSAATTSTSFQALPEYRAVVKRREGMHDQVLGPVVGKSYSLLQWDQFVNLGASFLDHGAKFELAGTIKDGTKGLIQIGLRDGDFDVYREVGEPRRFEAKICLRNGCDGVTSFFGGLLTQDVRCMNQMPALLASGNAFRYRHTGNTEVKIVNAKKLIDKAIDAFDNEHMFFQWLENQRMTDDEAELFFANTLTKTDGMQEFETHFEGLKSTGQTMFANKLNLLMRLYKHGTGNQGLTRLDALSAVTEYYDFANGQAVGMEALNQECRQREAIATRTDRAINSMFATQNDATEAYERSLAERRVRANAFNGSSNSGKERARKLISR